MKIKKYRAPTFEEAVNQIRDEIGKEAVILHTRDVKVGGWLGLFAKTHTQVTVGIEMPQKAGVDKAEVQKEPLSEKQQRIQAHLESLDVRPSIKKSLLLTSTMIEKTGEAREQIILEKTLLTTLKPLTTAPGKARLLFLVGPTGVGKTTTLAKLAAKAIYEDNKKIALVTLDTFRIAAVDQLKKYGDILGCPVTVAYDEQELIDYCEKETDADLILIDTAGRNYLGESFPEELKAFIRSRTDVEFHITVSLTMKANDLQVIIDQFTDVPITGLILTKKDETRSLGVLMELLYTNHIPVSCVTNGQNVPGDICYPSEGELIRWLKLRGQ